MKKQKVKTYPNGGIIEGPKLGLIGHYTGTKADIIAPLVKLKSIIMKDETINGKSGTGMDIIVQKDTVLI